MIVKFFKHGKGAASGALNYLLKQAAEPSADGKRQPLVPREHARVLVGDADMTAHLIDSTQYQQKYKSGVLSFSERANELTEQQKFEIMQRFEDTLFAGLDRDQFDILWIEHADKDIDEKNPVGRLELNFVIPCQELRSGKRLQPYWHGADKRRVNAFKNIINHEFELTDPNSPNRKLLINQHSDNAPRPLIVDTYTRANAESDKQTIVTLTSRKELKESIDRYMSYEYENNLLANRVSVIKKLRDLELKIERTTDNSITVSSRNLLDRNHNPLKIRLKGGLYDKDFDVMNYKSYLFDLEQEKYDKAAKIRFEQDKKTLETGLQIKEQYHQELYADAVAPEPMSLDIVAITLDTIGDKKLYGHDNVILDNAYESLSL